jgi:hypothetical protein
MVKAKRLVLLAFVVAALGTAAPTAHAGLFGKKSEAQKSAQKARKKARRYNAIGWGNEWKRVYTIQHYQPGHYLDMY